MSSNAPAYILSALLVSILLAICAERTVTNWHEVRAAYAPV